MQETELYIALIHHPVFNKKGETICSAVTNLDLHDIARAARTFGVKHYYIVTTLEDQKELTDKIVKHWTEGKGGILNPARKEALRLIQIKGSLDAVVKELKGEAGGDLKLIATTAKKRSDSISFANLRSEICKGGRYLLLFGTAWGLTDTIVEGADWVLEPLVGVNGYNHLSVRSAASIILDRLTMDR